MTWQAIKEKLQSDLSPEAYNLWIQPLECRQATSHSVELAGPDKFFCSWVADNYLTSIRQALTEIGMEAARVSFSVDPSLAPQDEAKDQFPGATRQLTLPTMAPKNTFVRALNPRYIFDEFVVGDCNEMAHSACHAMAHGDRSLGHCLFIASGTGLGKSHLTHAVAHQVLSANPGVRLNYLTAQQLTAEMVRAIQAKKMESFKEKYQSSDILLMEDIHTLSGKTKTQEELSMVLDILLETGKTVIFTGGRTPKDIRDIDPALRSRFTSGLVATISKPDLDTRIRITGKHAAGINLDLSEELTLYLAENMNGDIRQLKSAIVGIKAKANIRKSKPDLDMVKEVLATLVDRRQSITPEAIRDYMSELFKVSVSQLQSKSRKKQVTFPRQVSMYFSRKYTDCALSEIGKAFNRDHSTVVHSIKVITDAMMKNAGVKGQVELLDKKLKKHFL